MRSRLGHPLSAPPYRLKNPVAEAFHLSTVSAPAANRGLAADVSAAQRSGRRVSRGIAITLAIVLLIGLVGLGGLTYALSIMAFRVMTFSELKSLINKKSKSA